VYLTLHDLGWTWGGPAGERRRWPDGGAPLGRVERSRHVPEPLPRRGDGEGTDEGAWEGGVVV